MSRANDLRRIIDERQSSLVLVTETRNGQALKLTDREGRSIPLQGHLSDVPWLMQGDEVMIAQTAQGAIVVGRLRRGDEVPQATFSLLPEKMALTSDRPLTFQVGASRLELLPDGQVRIEGKVITHVGQDAVQLYGPLVEVN